MEVFQIYLNDNQLRTRLQYTSTYSSTVQRTNDLSNCANLVLVILGIVDPRYYLESCTVRGQLTSEKEVMNYISSSVYQCKGVYPSLEVRAGNPGFIEEISKRLSPSSACIFLVQWMDGRSHASLLRKTDTGVLQYIDPQHSMVDGTYPFAVIGLDAITEFLKQKAKVVGVLVSNVPITKEESLSQKCLTTQAPMLVEKRSTFNNDDKMLIDGGKKKRRLRKNGKKTKKSRKHHGMRTRRRRY